MNNVKAWALFAALVAGLAMPSGADAMEAKAQEISNEYDHYKVFTFEGFHAGQCDVEEGATIKYFADGHLSFNAILNCKEPYQYSYNYVPYQMGGWNDDNNDLEIEAEFVGYGKRRFDEEFDGDIGIEAMNPLANSKEGEYRYEWTENRPANSRRAHRFGYIEHAYLMLD